MKIEKYLILNKYILSLFGAKDFKDLQRELANKLPGYNIDGRSHFVNTLKSLEGLKRDVLSEETLLKYDENIQFYVRKISYHRESITLKYFQYLAVLFAEIVLDNLKNRKFEFLYNLNQFLEDYRREEKIEIIDNFTENDLKKLAFWMATGSGKTLIMHINYYQFLRYKLFSPDNIILITPNEGLSKQHFEELQKSGIPCRLYSGSLNGGLKSENEVLVIEMTKFVEEKKGSGVTLPVDTFEGKNLIFVDEGHKGKKSEEQKWARLRNKLAENGFVFEYSATFGQILSEKEKDLLKEYGKSIVFDYSYKYFYLDGYGKDFFIINVKNPKDVSDQKFQEIMFVANLLSFYEQILAFGENKNTVREYNIEKPLWIFVGTTVTGKQEESDVLQIIEFIRKVIQDENWTKDCIANILKGKTNLKDENDKDIFEENFTYLRNKHYELDTLYDNLCRRIFGGVGSLKIYEIKNAEGELGLRIGENDYFGVVNIGNISGFKKLLEQNGFSIEHDAISGSLFDEIKYENSKINVLIGSKKFIEGWDTWRVSSMGLLNIGTGQGPQIIQLFGRGVRLKGKEMSLKRSGESKIKILETLNIYGIKADYLSRFLEAIQKEEVEYEEIKIPVKTQHQEKWEKLYLISKSEKRFENEKVLKLEIDEKIYYTVDFLPKVTVYHAKERKEEGIKTAEIKPETKTLKFSTDHLEFLDWDSIYREISDFKLQRGYYNLIFDKDTLRQILLFAQYNFKAFPEIFEIKKENVGLWEDVAILVIKKYIDLFYRKRAKLFEMDNLGYENITQLRMPFISEEKREYIVQIDKKKKDLIKEIKELVKNLTKLVEDDSETLPRIHFDGSLCVPILLQSKEIDKISPSGLVESEKKFVYGLKEYLKANKTNFEIYLLRNYPFSGVGFQLQWHGFYPDFIMWIIKDKKQIIAFVDPKGLEHTKDLNDEKINFAKEVKELEKKIGEEDIVLESFILSETSYKELIKGKVSYPSKNEYEKNHVLFLDDEDWTKKLFEILI